MSNADCDCIRTSSTHSGTLCATLFNRLDYTIDDNSRKTARYNSQNVLSGLLVCGECGNNYRRITRPSGEIVWRCADKVENGKQAICSNSITVSDEDVKKIICEQLNLGIFDEEVVRDLLDTVTISKDGISIQVKSDHSLGMLIL